MNVDTGVYPPDKRLSKEVETHPAMVAPHFMRYNFCRIDQTLRVTPAMQAGLADQMWKVEELARLLD